MNRKKALLVPLGTPLAIMPRQRRTSLASGPPSNGAPAPVSPTPRVKSSSVLSSFLKINTPTLQLPVPLTE